MADSRQLLPSSSTPKGSVEITSASFAYPSHDGAARSELAQELVSRERIKDGFVLSTCLRVEVVVSGGMDKLDRALTTLFGGQAHSHQPSIRQGEDAVTHLFRVASGLESPILGEMEILTQFRQEVIEAEKEGTLGGLMTRLLESAVSAGRQARELLPGSPHNSMAAVAAQATALAGRVAVLGSGIMASAVVEALRQLPAPPEITVVARHPEKVTERSGIHVWPFRRATEALATFPAVVSATSAERSLMTDTVLNEIAEQKDGPLLLIDMAMPPDFTAPESSRITYMDIDHLARIAGRRPRSKEADRFVERAAAEAHRQFRHHHEVGPVIEALMRNADSVVDSTVERFSGRLGQGEDRAVLRQTAHTVARTLLAGPVSFLKETEGDSEVLGTIVGAFGVDE